MAEEHEGTLEKASTGWYYIQCSCGWKSARSWNTPDGSWDQHRGHQFSEESLRKLREKYGLQ